jgi:hypothetical protein
MNWLWDRTWLLASARAVLAFVALVVLAPGSVRASCGDYLTAAKHDDSSAMTSALPSFAQRHEPVLPPSRVPCSGTSCSKRNNEPLSVPLAPVQRSAEQWGWVSQVLVIAGPERTSWLVPLVPTLSTRHSDCIYHPPRRTLVVSL